MRRIIREAIVDGRIPAGAALREARLQEMLGTSRGTIREALRHLVQEGLVEYRLHQGAFVPRQKVTDRLDVYVAREAIETWAARRLLESDEKLDLSKLETAIDAMAADGTELAKPSEETIAADLRFHHELVRMAGSDISEDMPYLNVLLKQRPGMTIPVTVLRGGRETTLDVIVGQR